MICMIKHRTSKSPNKADLRMMDEDPSTKNWNEGSGLWFERMMAEK